MRPYFATTLKNAALSVALPACLAVTAWGAKTVEAPAAQASEPAAAPRSAPAVKPFDPAVIPEVAPPKSALGYHYAELTSSQASALRRGFKLPLDALAVAKSPADLARAVVVAPLPDPNRPLLAVSPATESLANPFADSEAISFRRDPMKALGALLAARDRQQAPAAAAPPEDDPFGAPDAAATASVKAPRAEVDSSEDPFGADADPFGDSAETEGPGAEPAAEEDPFGAF